MVKSRSRSLSPRRRDRIRDRDPRQYNNDRDDRNDREKDRRRKRERSRDRSRSRDRRRKSPGKRHRSRSRSESRNPRDRKSHVQVSERPRITEADLEGKTPDEQEMMKMMGFCGFDTTKGKKVPGNDTGEVHVILKRKYRQYMNRKGGFNRPLDFVA